MIFPAFAPGIAHGPATLPDGCELPFAGGLIGLLNYDFGTRLEPLPQRARDDSGLPLARWGCMAGH